MKVSYIIKKICFSLIYNAHQRGKFLQKYGNFKTIGNNIFFQPRKLPGEPHLISFKSNISVATGVLFITHDVMHHVFNNIEVNSTYINYGCIEIGNNVFIGANSLILPNVKVGDNCIIAAGSIVNKNVAEGTIVGGNPAKKIGDFNTLFLKRKQYKIITGIMTNEELADITWRNFYALQRNKK